MERCPEHDKLETKIDRIESAVHKIDKTASAIDVRVNGSIDDISKHIEHGTAWRISIVGIAGLIVLQIIGFVFMWGQLCKVVETNTARIEGMEELHPRVVY